MQDKFLNLSKGLRWLIVIALWVLTIASFGGCVLVKQNDDLQWVEVLLTSLGLFFCVVAVCITIVHITLKSNNAENSEK